MKPPYFIAFFFSFLLIIFSLFFLLKKEKQQQNWQFLIKDQVGIKSELNVGKNLTFDEESIYFIDGKGLLHSLDKKSGRVNWLKKLRDHSPFEIRQDENFIYISSFDSHIYKINKNNGYIVWSYNIPHQFWPDTEVVFDDNDELVFFADRGGFLYALNKNNGQEVWKKEFGTIDNNKSFVEKSIHFGFLKQEDETIIIDHFPSKKNYTVNKKTGKILDEKDSELKINYSQVKEFFEFDNFQIRMEQNIISQPLINLIDKDNKLLWSYRTEHRMNRKEVYQNEDRIYYLNADNTILESIIVANKNPNNNFFKKINFELNENFAAHHPFKNSNPQVNSEEIKYDITLEINKIINKISYLSKNFKILSDFLISSNEKQNYLEFNILHDENFYRNVFNDLEVEMIFKNQDTNQEIKIRGFYYDHNTWKIRAKLAKGYWNWKLRIKTPFVSKKFSGSVQINQEFPKSIIIDKNNFTLENEELFFPLGIQDVIIDKSRDGNNLNNMGHAREIVPPKEEKSFNYLSFANFLDLYQRETNLNIFRYGPDNWAPSIWESLANTKEFSMNVKGNLEGDEIIEELQKREFKIMMSIFAFYPPYTSKEAFGKPENRAVLEKYLDYVIARYSSSIDIWEISNEAAPILEWQNFISDYIFNNDPYKHPITTNLEEKKLKNSDLLSIHLYIKKPTNNLDLVNQLDGVVSKLDWQKAIIISEFGFQGSNHFQGSADWLRKFAWISAMQNIGLISWNTGYGFYEDTYNGNIYLGPQERNYLKILSDFIPKIQRDGNEKVEFKIENDIAIYKLSNTEYELYYLLNLNNNREISHSLELKNQKSKKIEVINPKNNLKFDMQNTIEKEALIKLPSFKDDIAVKIAY